MVHIEVHHRMKKLSAKQRVRRSQPSRKTLPKVQPPVRPIRLAVEPEQVPLPCFTVRLPSEPNPHETRPDQPPVLVYVGWRGRALHFNLAVVFQYEAEAAHAAAPFPDAVVEQRDQNDILNDSEEYDWMEVAIPDLQRRKEAFPKDCSLDKKDLQRLEELERQLLEAMTIYDERAPSDERFKDFTVQTMVTEMEEEFVLLPPPSL